MKNLILFSFYTIIFINSIVAQETFKTQKISIFKDGNSFVQKKGKVNTTNSIYKLTQNQIPLAMYGTFWVNSPHNNIKSVRSYVDTLKVDKKNDVITIADMVMANKGKKVILKTQNDTLIGIIEDVKVSEVNGQVYDYITSNYKNIPSYTPNLLIFKTLKGKYISLNVSEVKSIESDEKPLDEYNYKVKEIKNSLDIAFNSNQKVQDLEMMYVQKGLSWAPFYNLELDDNGKGKLILRSEVINDAETIENTSIDFVVGAPNFKYASQLTGLVNFLNNQNLYSIYNQYNRSNVFVGQFSNALSLGASGKLEQYKDSDDSSFVNNMVGDQVEDFYFYNISNVSLGKGEKAHFQLFETDINYKPVYKCTITGNGETQYGYSNSYSYDLANSNNVFHTIKLTNNSKNPFTTAPVLITKKQNNQVFPIAQDIMYYTPIKGTTSIIVNQTRDIMVTSSEIETERKEDNLNWFNHNWYKLKITAKIKVKNYKNTDCDVNIHRTVYGFLEESNLDWKYTTNDPKYHQYYNKSNEIDWDFSIKASEEKEITYTYYYYYYY